ncbi:MAG: PAS domain-containing protein [Firmicutes bacterium]|nr:PAS domain-containing protein [Bacillota bacterium]
MHEKLKFYLDFAEFLGKSVDKNTEVVLHETVGDNPGIVYIYNGYVSGRQVGAPLSEFSQEMVNNKEDHSLYRVNYATVANDGSILRSSSFFIRDDDNTLLGILCINSNVSQYLQLSEQLRELAGLSFDEEVSDGDDTQIYLTSAKDVILENIQSILTDMNVNTPPNRLTAAEKQIVINVLHKRGIFNLKGSVAKVAAIMCVSEPTIYRYLPKSNL